MPASPLEPELLACSCGFCGLREKSPPAFAGAMISRFRLAAVQSIRQPLAPPLRAAHLVQFPPRAGTPLFPTQEEIALATACFLTASRTDLLNQALPTLRPLTRLSRRRVDHGPRLQPRAASMSVDTTGSRHSRPRVGSKYLHTRVLLMGGQAKVNQKKVCQMMRRSPSREML